MSELYLVNLKNHNMNLEELKLLSNNLMRLALDKNFAIFFNSYDYAKDLILENSMKEFFILSDSFLYKNCGFLNTNFLENLLDYNESEKQFVENFDFLNLINETIFKYKINEIEIFITADGAVNCIEDFEEIECKCNEYLKVLFKNIIIKANEYAYGFPTLKVSVKL